MPATASRSLVRIHFDIEPAIVDVHHDDIALANRRDRTADGRLRSDVAAHQALGRAAEPAVGDQRAFAAEALPDQSPR